MLAACGRVGFAPLPDAGVDFACTTDRWCQQPSGVTGTLYSVWAVSPDDVWAAGDQLLHWDGNAWTAVDTGATGFRDVWASPTAAWAVSITGNGVLTNLGGAWHVSLASPDAYAIWGASNSDVWVVGDDGTTDNVHHWDGSTWSTISALPQDAHYAVWGSGPANVWVGTVSHAVHHYDGATWTTIDPGDGGDLEYDAGFTSGPNDVFAQGYRVMHYNGTSWTPTCTSGCNFGRIWEASSGELWGVGLAAPGFVPLAHVVAGAWQPADPGVSVRLYGVSGQLGHVWAVGDGGTILHRPP